MSAPKTAEDYVSIAIEMLCDSYRTEHTVAPVVTMMGERGDLIFMLGGPEFHPTEAAHQIVSYFSKVWPMRFIEFHSEVWHQRVNVEDFQPLERGDLAKAAETDPSVQTAIMCFVYDVKNPDQSATTIAVVEDVHPEITFDITKFPAGINGGYAPEGIDKAYRRAFVPPNDLPVDDIVKMVVAYGGNERRFFQAVAYAGTET